MTRRTPEEIVKILNSIVQVNVDDGYIEVLFDDSGNYGPSSKEAFVPGSFTRKLLELIEDHLCNDGLCLSCDARELKYMDGLCERCHAIAIAESARMKNKG
jgi:ribosomal protein L40E